MNAPPKTGEGLSLKTQRNVRDSFRAFTRWAHRRKYLAEVPHFEPIVPDPHVPDTIAMDELGAALGAIEWEKVRLFLAAASHALRLGELRAFTLADYRDGKLRLNKAVQGPRTDDRVAPRTKNRWGEWLVLLNALLVAWCEWRVAPAGGRAPLDAHRPRRRPPEAADPRPRPAHEREEQRPLRAESPGAERDRGGPGADRGPRLDRGAGGRPEFPRSGGHVWRGGRDSNPEEEDES